MPTRIKAGTSTSGGVFEPDTAGTLELQTGSTPTTAIAIDASQNVGIGINSPVTRLHIQSSASNTRAKIVSELSGSVYNSGIEFARTTVSGGALIDTARNTSVGGVGLAFSTTADNTAEVNGTYTERMRITSDGDALIGATSTDNSERLNVTKNLNFYLARFKNTRSSANIYGIFVHYPNLSPNDTDNQFIGCNDSSGNRFTVRSNGGIANFSGNNVNLSDAREKTNIELAGSYLNKICAIPVKTFNYIDQNRETDDGLTLGVIAQDVQAVAPELVMESNWGTKEEPKMRLSIYQTDLQYALMKAIQELKAELDSVKSELATLKGVA